MSQTSINNLKVNNINSYALNSHHCSPTKWLHGVKYITWDHSGTIYWKGCYIDVLKNASDPLHTSYLQVLAERCRYLEGIGVSVSIKTVVFFWGWFCNMQANDRYKKLLSRCPDVRVCKDKILFVFAKAACEYDGRHWQFTKLPHKDSRCWETQWSCVALKHRGYAGMPLYQSDLDGLYHCFKHYKVPTNLLELMADELNPINHKIN